MTDTTNQEVGGSETAAVAEGVDTDALIAPEAEAPEAEPSEPEYDDDGNLIEPDEDAEEIEFEGVKASVPKSLAEKIKLGAMRTADYTKKTQDLAAARHEVAQTRASLDQEAAQRRQAIAQEEKLVRDHAAELVSLKTVASQLAEYEALTPQDWANINAQDPDTARQHQFTYMQLKDARDRAIAAVTTKAQELDAARQQQTAIQAQQSQAYLAREIPNWGQETYTKLGTLALEFGYQPQEVAQVMSTDPRAFKGLQEIATLRSEIATLKAAAQKTTVAKTAQQKVATSQAAAPVPKVGGSTPPTRKSVENMSPEEYQAWRHAQQRQKRAAGGRFA